jgi:hypothetical protein
MTVTASVLYDLVQCRQRVALDAFGKPAKRDAINPFVRLLWGRHAIRARDDRPSSGALHLSLPLLN